MPHHPSLELWLYPGPDGIRPPLPALPPGMRPRLEGVGLVLNHALLVGEILGCGVDEAREIVDGVHALPGEPEATPIFLPEDLPVLLRVYGAVRDALDAALDADGAPRGEGGARLAASDLVASGPGGLYTVSRRLPLVELLDGVRELTEWMEWAMRNRVYIRYEH